MNKVLVEVTAPLIDVEFEAWIPINRNIGDIIIMLTKSINELIGGSYMPNEMPALYDKQTSKEYDVNANVKDSNIINGTKLILI